MPYPQALHGRLRTNDTRQHKHVRPQAPGTVLTSNAVHTGCTASSPCAVPLSITSLEGSLCKDRTSAQHESVFFLAAYRSPALPLAKPGKQALLLPTQRARGVRAAQLCEQLLQSGRSGKRDIAGQNSVKSSSRNHLKGRTSTPSPGGTRTP